MKKRTRAIVIGTALLVSIGFSLQASTNRLSRTIMKVSKLTCGSCLVYIDSKLKGYPEVDGMGASLRQGIVAVDHKSSLKSDKIASIITKLGYPAEVIKTITIENKDAFSARRQANAASCCGAGGGYAQNTRTGSTSQTQYTPGSCGVVGGCGIGPGSGRSCGAGASAWRRLFNKSPEVNTPENDTTKPEKKTTE